MRWQPQAEAAASAAAWWRVDPQALQAAIDADLLALRASGALDLAYAQLVSQPHVLRLARLAAAVGEQRPARPVMPPVDAGSGDLDLEFLRRVGTIDLSGLR